MFAIPVQSGHRRKQIPLFSSSSSRRGVISPKPVRITVLTTSDASQYAQEAKGTVAAASRVQSDNQRRVVSRKALGLSSAIPVVKPISFHVIKSLSSPLQHLRIISWIFSAQYISRPNNVLNALEVSSLILRCDDHRLALSRPERDS